MNIYKSLCYIFLTIASGFIIPQSNSENNVPFLYLTFWFTKILFPTFQSIENFITKEPLKLQWKITFLFWTPERIWILFTIFKEVTPSTKKVAEGNHGDKLKYKYFESNFHIIFPGCPSEKWKISPFFLLDCEIKLPFPFL